MAERNKWRASTSQFVSTESQGTCYNVCCALNHIQIGVIGHRIVNRVFSCFDALERDIGLPLSSSAVFQIGFCIIYIACSSSFSFVFEHFAIWIKVATSRGDASRTVGLQTTIQSDTVRQINISLDTKSSAVEVA